MLRISRGHIVVHLEGKSPPINIGDPIPKHVQAQIDSGFAEVEARLLTEARWLLIWALWRRKLQLLGFDDPRWDYERGAPVTASRHSKARKP